MTALGSALKTSLGELRMQMLGVQVLFGFQFQGLFQDTFPDWPGSVRIASGAGLSLMVVVLCLITAVACQHRIVEQGAATLRIFRLARRYANYSLIPFGAGIACAIYAAARVPFGRSLSSTLALMSSIGALGGWYGIGIGVRSALNSKTGAECLKTTETPLHAKIEQMLTEARVILPGVQALLGFQLIVMMTKTFGALPANVQHIHLIALMSSVVATILLIAPAALHRIAFYGEDDPSFHRIGSNVITIALLPLTSAIVCDVWVAFSRLSDDHFAIAAACLTAALLICCWYIVPLMTRERLRRGATEPRRQRSASV
jgi:hypothetical protein